MEHKTGGFSGTLRNKRETKRESSRTALEQRERKKREPGGQTGKLQVICVQDRAEREKEARWTDRHASSDLRTRTS